jgi:hypothetical protein
MEEQMNGLNSVDDRDNTTESAVDPDKMSTHPGYPKSSSDQECFKKPAMPKPIRVSKRIATKVEAPKEVPEPVEDQRRNWSVAEKERLVMALQDSGSRNVKFLVERVTTNTNDS